MVIDAFFVRAADDSVCHHDGPSSGRLDEREHFLCHTGIIADVGPFGEPATKRLTENELSDFSRLCQYGCGQTITEEQDVDRDHPAEV